MPTYNNIVFIIVLVLFLSISCHKSDNTCPTVTLNGADTMIVALKSAFVDPGATAVDDWDGKVEVIVTGNVNTNSSGQYTLTYTATDQAGNSAAKTRTVYVDAALYIAGYYSVTDIINLGDTSTYYDTISASNIVLNKIHFVRFGNYDNANVYATIAGSTITVPQQDISCGAIGSVVLRTFSGAGNYNATEVVIHYTKVTNDTIVTGTGTYTRQ
jgi:hypothetical protein